MKTLKSLLAIAILTVVSYGVNAQISTTMNASAEVQTALTITNTAMNFGMIGKETTGAIVLDANGVANAFTGADRTVGTVTVTGQPNTSVDLIFPASITLTDAVSSETLTVTLEVVGSKLSADQATASALSTGADITTAANADPNPGKYYMWVGGSIPSIAAGQATGTYTGSATFTVAYN